MGTSGASRPAWSRSVLLALCASIVPACVNDLAADLDARAPDAVAIVAASPTPLPREASDSGPPVRDEPPPARDGAVLLLDDAVLRIDPSTALAMDAGRAEVGSDAAAARDGSSDRAPPSVPACAAFDVSRRCVDEHTLRVCTAYFDADPPAIFRCAPDERCAAGADGVARCAPATGCRAGSSRCTSSGELERCVDGLPVASPCGGVCVGGTLGAACAPSAPTRPLEGTLRYSRRPIRDDLLQWGPAVVRPARGFAIQLRRGADVLARAVSDGEGRFSIAVPATLVGGEVIEAVAADATDGHVELAVADPALARGEYSPSRTVPAAVAPWSWSWPVPEAEASTFEIPGAQSPAAAVFDDIRSSLATLRDAFGTAPHYDLVVWVGLGVRWTCGSCFSDLDPIERSNQRFDAQIWLNGSTTDEEYWSAAVTLHELGHYVMAAWGTAVWEGGSHYLGVPTMPGQAWSEGWATWVSAALRDDPRLYAVADGTFYWWNIDARTYVRSVPWTRPSAGGSTLQLLDENEVSAILWSLSRATSEAGGPGLQGLLRAVALPRMTTAPFARCYTRHVWVYDWYEDACAVAQSTPHLADYLDALRCAGTSAEVVTGAMGTYPYPVDSALCEGAPAEGSCPSTVSCVRGASRPQAPLHASWIDRTQLSDGAHALIARVEYPGDLGVPATVTVETSGGATLLEGPPAWTLRPGERRDVDVTVAVPSGSAASVLLRVEAAGSWGGARAVIPWRAVPIAQPPIVPASPTRS